MRLLAVVMSGAVVAGGSLGADPAHTRTENCAGAGAGVDCGRQGARWLASVQGADGGWGQDGGEASSARPGERLESSGNDVANTAVAALALLQAGRRYSRRWSAHSHLSCSGSRRVSRRPGNHRSPGRRSSESWARTSTRFSRRC